MEIKETLGGDEKSWGLWHEHRGSLRRYTLQGRSSLVKLSWLKDLKELQQRSSLPTNSKCPSGKEVHFFSSNFCHYVLFLKLQWQLKDDIVLLFCQAESKGLLKPFFMANVFYKMLGE